MGDCLHNVYSATRANLAKRQDAPIRLASLHPTLRFPVVATYQSPDFLVIEQHRFASRRVYRRALKEGQLVRPSSCESCGVTCKPDGHHEDYAQPLIVRWLCKACHVAADVACGSRRRGPDSPAVAALRAFEAAASQDVHV